MDRSVYQKRFWQVEGALLLVALCFALGVWTAERLPFRMGCLSVTLLGLYCPVCGGTRSVFALISGEVLVSVRYFPPIAVIVPVFIWLQLRALLAYFGRGDGETVARSARRWGWILLGVLVLHTVLRNVGAVLGYDPLGALG